MEAFILLLAFFLFGCKQDEFPVDKIYVVDIKDQHAHEKIYTNKQTLSVKYGQDYPLDHVDNYVCISMQDYLNLKDFVISEEKKAQCTSELNTETSRQ